METISIRLLEFGCNVIKLSGEMTNSFTGKHVSHQLIRSATSAGANYEEACGGESTKDFIHKLQISLKELKESLYWLKLIEKAELTNQNKHSEIKSENEQLIKIIAKSVITAKKR